MYVQLRGTSEKIENAVIVAKTTMRVRMALAENTFLLWGKDPLGYIQSSGGNCYKLMVEKGGGGSERASGCDEKGG